MRVWFGTLLLAALAIGSPVNAQQSPLTVHATVTPRTTLESLSAATIEVSATDILRGYVESVTRYRVRSNDLRGYLLQVRPRVLHAEAVQLAGMNEPAALGVDGVEVYHPWVPGAHEVAVRLRVKLQGVRRPGPLALPVHVTVASL